jgi:predicted GNAT family acetyltransferase
VRDGGERFVPLCPFIRAYVERHHDYDDLRA